MSKDLNEVKEAAIASLRKEFPGTRKQLKSPRNLALCREEQNMDVKRLKFSLSVIYFWKAKHRCMDNTHLLILPIEKSVFWCCGKIDPLALRTKACRGLAMSLLPSFLSPHPDKCGLQVPTVGLVEITWFVGTEEFKSG